MAKTIEELINEVNNDNNLSDKQKEETLEALRYADYFTKTTDKAHHDEINNATAHAQEQTKLDIKNRITAFLEKEGNQKYREVIEPSKEPTLLIEKNSSLAEELFNKYKFKNSDEFKKKVVEIANKLDEYGINDTNFGGESGSKQYAFYKYYQARSEMKEAVASGDLDKIKECVKSSKDLISKYTELLDMSKKLSDSFNVVDNLDLSRNDDVIPEIYDRYVEQSNLSGVFQLLCLAKTANINIEDLVNDPIKYANIPLNNLYN